MKFFIQIQVFIISWCGVVNCRHFVKEKHIFKTFHFGIVPLPPHHFALSFEKLTPFGSYEFKHKIKKRQITQPALPPAINEVPASDGPLKLPMMQFLEPELKTMEKPAEVLITSVVQPFEPGKQISFLLPVDSEVVITPAVKDVVPEPHTIPLDSEVKSPEIVVHPSPDIVAITPKPIHVVPPPEVKPIEPKVVLTTPIDSTVPPIPVKPVQVPPVPVKPVSPAYVQPVPLAPIEPIPPPIINPIINSIPIAPYLYTNIKGIPFFTPAANVIPFLTPAAVPFPEATIPFATPPIVKEEVPVVKEVVPIMKEEVPVIKEVVPVIKEVPVMKEMVPVIPVVKEELPPVVKEEIPPVVVKEEPPPNIFVKGSRFVLYFGSMMLQMLSRFVNGEINLNQVPPPFLGFQ